MTCTFPAEYNAAPTAATNVSKRPAEAASSGMVGGAVAARAVEPVASTSVARYENFIVNSDWIGVKLKSSNIRPIKQPNQSLRS